MLFFFFFIVVNRCVIDTFDPEAVINTFTALSVSNRRRPRGIQK